MPDNDTAAEFVTLLTTAAERAEVARRLLAAAGNPRLVRTTSSGFRVPRWVAEAAGLLLARDAAPDADGSTLAAAAPDEQPAEADEQPDEQPAEADEQPDAAPDEQPAEQPAKPSRGRKK